MAAACRAKEWGIHRPLRHRHRARPARRL